MNILTPIERPAAESPFSHRTSDAHSSFSSSSFLETPLSGQGQVWRVPIAVEGCFGWLHTSADGVSGETAVLICPALVRDALQSHHALRLLADECAAAGYPTMRFDYPGTGDSCDLPAAAEPWAEWQRSVNAAADWLRHTQSARSIVLIGLRLGATLATLAAQQRTDIAGLILLAPVLRGRSYIKQLRIQAQLELRGTDPGPASLQEASVEGGLDFHEISFPPATIERIAAIDLTSAHLPAGLPVAICPQAPSSLVTRCAASWRERGVAVECVRYDGLEPLLRVDTLADYPPPDFRHITHWLQAAVPSPARPSTPRPATPAAGLLPDGCIETPLRFGPRNRLFGMLCRPDVTAADPGRAGTVVMIVNTGRDPHYGVGRFAVQFARRLARSGIASLRMDFTGLGDSTGLPGSECRHTSLFADARHADIAAGLDLLQDHGFRDVAVQGLCSGGYHAFQAAIGDPRIASLMLVNLPLFTWRPGDDAPFIAHKLTPTHRYAMKLLRPHNLRRLLSGKVQFDRLIRAQFERAIEGLQRSAAGKLFGQHNRFGPNAATRRGMAALSRRNVRTLLLFGPHDPGLYTMYTVFGPDAAALQDTGAVMQIVPGLNHELSARWMRNAVAERLVQFVTAQPSFTPVGDHAAEIIPDPDA